MSKRRKSGFVLAEALISLVLISTAITFEYEQVRNFKQQDTRLKIQYQNASTQRAAAIKSWHDYVEK
ncbi:hypothetical protein KIJ00_00300 [Leuconostoc gelidum subsp. aenigmaticum]|uniref:hypothetical protein n=1 Tax=Leuconostoc gelidum TaxID=1244 RepID=UPI001CC3980C|nr:hypothetical protein [Leuconostoc gelidum]MBZ6007708.1 hypothetical protein [Leuconostoc gelidum subsp. aenigmaticum]